MGWDYTRGAKKADIVARLIAPRNRERASEWSNQQQRVVELDYEREDRTIAHRLVGNTLWMVREIIRYQADRTKTERLIVCCLLQRGRSGWGYKSMSEGMHPYFYDCPLEFLDLAPVASEKWRDEVRKYHKRLGSAMKEFNHSVDRREDFHADV